MGWSDAIPGVGFGITKTIELDYGINKHVDKYSICMYGGVICLRLDLSAELKHVLVPTPQESGANGRVSLVCSRRYVHARMYQMHDETIWEVVGGGTEDTGLPKKTHALYV